jgi:hypothetical protein
MSALGRWNTKARRAISRIWLSIDLLDRGVREAVTDRGDLALPSERQVAPPARLGRHLPSNARDHLSIAAHHDVLHNASAQPEQARREPDTAHVLSPRGIAGP